ncbi:MAG: hypothetical protein LBO04_00955 [Spirochaetaceae bacterium]|jgi:branched-chain amino acid transport system substrate-binding protein|nr:hypothetical protein [Spirochaetaceae bacterium]
MKGFFKILVASTVAASLLTVTACSKKEAAASGVYEPLTGANTGGGAIELEGVEAGGKTYKFELVIADNNSDKVEASTRSSALSPATRCL